MLRSILFNFHQYHSSTPQQHTTGSTPHQTWDTTYGPNSTTGTRRIWSDFYFRAAHHRYHLENASLIIDPEDLDCFFLGQHTTQDHLENASLSLVKLTIHCKLF